MLLRGVREARLPAVRPGVVRCRVMPCGAAGWPTHRVCENMAAMSFSLPVSDVTAPVVAQLVAYNARDIDAFAPCFSQDCLIEDGQGTVIMQGRQAIYESYGRMFAASPELQCTIVHRTVVGNYVLDEERVTGRGGNAGVGHVVAVYRVEGGLIVHVRFLR